MIVVGAPEFSSNSVRLVEVARRAGCEHAMLVERADEIDWTVRGHRAARHHRRRLGARKAGR